MFEKLKSIILEYSEIDEDALTPETNLRTDCALDSFSMINMIAAVENEFNVKFSDREISTIYTVQDVMDFIKSQE